jgi:hypothetical protein
MLRRRHSQTTLWLNDSTSRASETATKVTDHRSGRTPAAATTSTIPCTTATVFPQRVDGSGARSHGSTRPAVRNAYRMAPIAITQIPSEVATYTLRTSNRNASIS